MKKVLLLLIPIVLGCIVGPLIKDLPGFVLIAYDKTSIEMRLSVAVFAVLLTVILAVCVVFLLIWLFRSSSKVRRWRNSHSARRSRRKTIEGMLAYSEGQWKVAENKMIKAAKTSDAKLINYLIAAQAAQQQNAEVRRDAYLRLAHQAEPQAKVAIGLTQAKLQIKHQQFEQALASLKDIRAINPQHPYVLKLLARVYLKLQEWQKLLDLLSTLTKQKSVAESELVEMETAAIKGLLEQKVKQQDLEGLFDTWNKQPSIIRKNPNYQLFYAKYLVGFNQWQEAENLLTGLLKKGSSTEAIKLLGQLESPQPQKLLQFLEGWLKNAEEIPRETYLTLGKIAYQSQLWGKARHYLEQSLQQKPSSAGFWMMANTLEQLGDEAHAQTCYRQGLEFIAQTTDSMLVSQWQPGSEDLVHAGLMPKLIKPEIQS